MLNPPFLRIAQPVGCCAAALVLLCGCASSSPRAQGGEAPEQARWLAPAGGSDSAGANRQAFGLEGRMGRDLVIGHELASDADVPRYYAPIKEYTIEEIRAELEAMYDLDDRLVRASTEAGAPSDPLAAHVGEIDRAHADRLKEIVGSIGWPTRELVGLKATQAAYMVIQHAGSDIGFQNRCLAMMVDLVERGELPASYVALLTDRIRFFQHRPQVFGTQMRLAGNAYGAMVPTPTIPIEDPEHLDERRKLMGMPPHAEFVSAIAIAYEASKSDAGTALAEVPADQ